MITPVGQLRASCLLVCVFVVAGVKALDALTPLGRGASLLVIGPNDSGKSQLAVDALLGQVGGDVRAVLAATTMSAQELQQVVQVRRALGVL
jgi:F-type H+-transporting ATPase subunit alpha